MLELKHEFLMELQVDLRTSTMVGATLQGQRVIAGGRKSGGGPVGDQRRIPMIART